MQNMTKEVQEMLLQSLYTTENTLKDLDWIVRNIDFQWILHYIKFAILFSELSFLLSHILHVRYVLFY